MRGYNMKTLGHPHSTTPEGSHYCQQHHILETSGCPNRTQRVPVRDGRGAANHGHMLVRVVRNIFPLCGPESKGSFSFVVTEPNIN